MLSDDSLRQTIGVVLAVVGNLIISVGLALTKHAHNVNQKRATPLPYTRLPTWWMGFAATLLGEVGNFAAYGFTEASVVAPLGAVSVLANTFIAAFALGEGLRLLDLAGCGLCIIGGFVIVTSKPSTPVEIDVGNFTEYVQEPAFVVYMVILSAAVLVMVGFQDKYGHRHVAYYVMLCSLLGSVTVMSCKGVSTFVNLWLCCGEQTPFDNPVLCERGECLETAARPTGRPRPPCSTIMTVRAAAPQTCWWSSWARPQCSRSGTSTRRWSTS